MQLDHEFTVPAPIVVVWPVLLDIERVGPCMPGATVTKVDGSDFEGTVKVKVGPITVAYRGTARFLEIDEVGRRAVIEGRGKETRGSGTATATVTARLHDEGEQTRVTVSTDLAITGKPAQFGRGVMADVGAKLLGQFADCLSHTLAGQDQAAPAGPAAPAPAAAAAEPAGGTALTGVAAPAAVSGPAAVLDTGVAAERPAAGQPAAAAGRARPTSDTIDLISTAGMPVVKRLAPVLAGLVLLALLVAVLRRRR